MENCIFCKIIKKEIPSKIVYENDDFIAFEDIQAVAPVHLLCIPKKHYENFLEYPSSDMMAMSDFIKQTATKLNLNDKGFRLITNTKEDSGQSVFHLHFHLIAGGKLKWGKLT